MDAGDRLRDVVALSTLPATWLQADAVRVAESLAAALYTTMAPAFVYVCLRDADDGEGACTAQVGRNEASPELAAQLGPQILEWARQHAPDRLLSVVTPLAAGPMKVTARPIGFEAEWGVIAVGYPEQTAADWFHDVLLNVAAAQAATAVQNMRLVRSLECSVAETKASREKEARARRDIEKLQEVSRSLAGELDLERLMQRVTDAATQLSDAEFGAFFSNRVVEGEESYLLYTLSGAPREAFEKLGLPRNTPMFDATFRGEKTVRLDDVRDDPGYGRTPPHYGMPEGHLPVRSYLAVPVRSRFGGVFGGLFLAHPEVAVFTDRAERLVVGLANQAAVAMDNARLYGQAQEEISRRKQHEERQKMLLDELNHRVKNTLATVQSIAMQTLKGRAPLAEERHAFQARLVALSKVHDLLTATTWQGVDLREVVLALLAPHGAGEGDRFHVDGPAVHLIPKAALTLGMTFHELATNAAKYGALSNALGQVSISWDMEQPGESRRLQLCWTESGGPTVVQPLREGFGSLMIQRGLTHDLGGDVELLYQPTGLVCNMDLTLPGAEA